jgi:hypothetical protein
MRLKLILLLTFLYCGISYSQLSELSLLVKKNSPQQYSYIEEYSKNKWESDSAVAFEINKQTEGWVHVIKLLNEHYDCQEHKTIIVMAMLKYSEDSDNFSDANWWAIYQEIKNRMN